jgi:hypothetical protein
MYVRQRHGLSIEQLFEPHVRFFVARLDGLAVGCGGVAFFNDYAEVKRCIPGQRHVVGGSQRLCCVGSRMRFVERASPSCGSKPASTSRKRSVCMNVWGFGHEVHLANMPQCLHAILRRASFSKRSLRSQPSLASLRSATVTRIALPPAESQQRTRPSFIMPRVQPPGSYHRRREFLGPLLLQNRDRG